MSTRKQPFKISGRPGLEFTYTPAAARAKRVIVITRGDAERFCMQGIRAAFADRRGTITALKLERDLLTTRIRLAKKALARK